MICLKVQISNAYFVLQSMKYYLILLVLALLFALSSCRKNRTEVAVDHSSYYLPLNIGTTWIYQMDSIVYYGTGAEPDTFKYQVKHEIVDTYEGASGDPVYTFNISSRKDTNYQWRFERAFSISNGNTDVIKSDFDRQTLILSKPLSLDKLWNGNLYNTGYNEDYYVTKIHEAGTVGQFNFDSTLTIEQEEQYNLVNHYRGSTMYAKNIGLVFKEYERLSNLTDPGKITGVTYSLTLIAFGQ